MKKLFFVLACVAGLNFTCASAQEKKVLDKVEEYTKKAKQASLELEKLDAEGICFTEEEWNYVIARGTYWFYRTMVAVSEEWDIATGVLRQQAAAAASRTVRSKVALDENQELYANKFAEVEIYVATVTALEGLLELAAEESEEEDFVFFVPT